VTDFELEDAASITPDARVRSSVRCPNRPEPLSHRRYGAWLCWDHMKVMEQDRERR
jgi:hypothetical protein